MINLYAKMVSGIGAYHTDEFSTQKPDRPLTPYLTIDWDAILELVTNPQSVEKTQAQWLIPSTYPSRNFKAQEASGNYWLLWADLDNKPPPLGALSLHVDEILGGSYDFEAYNSRSASQENKKARLLIPLTEPLCFADWTLAQAILNDRLAALGVIPDRANERAAQLCYLPNKGAFYSSKSRREEQGFDPMQSWAAEIAAKREKLEADRLALEAIQAQAMAKKAALKLSDSPDIVGAFNQAYTLQEWLLKAGYSQRGNSFRHPHSDSGSYSATIKADNKGVLRVNALSPNDPLHTEGKGAHDAFGVYATLFHGGDTDAAIKEAGDNLLAIGGVSWNQAKRDEWRAKQAGPPPRQPEPPPWLDDEPPLRADDGLNMGNGRAQAQQNTFSAEWLDGDDLADTAEAPDFIINNILETDSHGLMIGASESFKTFCALKMAHCIATGNDFFEHQVFTTGKVLYICGEGKGALKRRIRALKQVEGGFNGNLRVLAMPLIIDDKTAMAWLSKQVREIKPLLVIADTFSSLTSTTKESDNSDVAVTLRLVKDACSDGKTASLIIHHLGKDATKGARGAYAFNANTDYVLDMVRSNGSMLTTLSSGKTKDSEKFSDIQMMAHVVELPLTRQDGTPTTSLILKPTDEQPKANKKGGQNLKKLDMTILEALYKAINLYGITPPQSVRNLYPDSPHNCPKKVVSLHDLNPLAYPYLQVTDSSKRITLKRILDKLQDSGKCMFYDGYYWWID